MALSDNHTTAGTRERLLQAAGEVFAAHGYRATTIREICKAAGSNVAAVNYHFGHKERLYSETLKYAYRRALEDHPPFGGLGPGEPPELRLSAFVRSLLHRMCGESRPAWYGRLMAREMAEPTRALDELVEQFIRPQYKMLLSIVRELLGAGTTEARARACAFSIVGQCLHYAHAREVIVRLEPLFLWSGVELERIAEHITGFSLAAIRQMARSGGQEDR